MSTKRYGDKLVGDFARSILLCFKTGLTAADSILASLELDPTPTNRRRVYQTAYRLRKQGHLHESQVTQSGLLQLQLSSVVPDASWNGEWHIVTFDIPEQQKLLRDRIRRLISRLGCYQLQKSVWVLPFNWRPQLDSLQNGYDGKSSDLVYIIAHSVSNQEELIEHFSKVFQQTDFDT